MTSTSQSAVQRFIASARELFTEEKDPAKRWKKMTPLVGGFNQRPIDQSTVERLARLPAGR